MPMHYSNAIRAVRNLGLYVRETRLEMNATPGGGYLVVASLAPEVGRAVRFYSDQQGQVATAELGVIHRLSPGSDAVAPFHSDEIWTPSEAFRRLTKEKRTALFSDGFRLTVEVRRIGWSTRHKLSINLRNRDGGGLRLSLNRLSSEKAAPQFFGLALAFAAGHDDGRIFLDYLETLPEDAKIPREVLGVSTRKLLSRLASQVDRSSAPGTAFVP